MNRDHQASCFVGQGGNKGRNSDEETEEDEKERDASEKKNEFGELGESKSSEHFGSKLPKSVSGSAKKRLADGGRIGGGIAGTKIEDACSIAARGQTQRQQQEVVARFRKGEFNVLVATCIAEEGLDIGEVDIIISFDALASPIRCVSFFCNIYMACRVCVTKG